MSANTFFITRLGLSGPSAKTAEISFGQGLNVVAGPSDTGKTFMVQCIDYAFGAGDVPKEIPQAAQYELVSLAIRTAAGDSEYVLERSLRGGNARLVHNGSTQVLLGKHQPDRDDTISHFLLALCGLSEKRIRTNNSGQTRDVSFRDVSPLILVDEESIIAERSPLHFGQLFGATAERSVFRLLLTGIDDSSVVAVEAPKVAKNKRDGKIEVIDQLLVRAREQLAALGIESSHEDVTSSLAKIEAVFEQVSGELRAEQLSIAAIEEQRRTAWAILRQADSRLEVLRQLRARFGLLQQQYASDLRRLKTIAEAGGRLGQLPEERCPVCGAAPEYHDKAHQGEQSSPEDVAAACRAEANKIGALLGDLTKTLEANVEEDRRLVVDRGSSQKELDRLSSELKTLLEPRLQAVLTRFSEGQTHRDKLRSAVDLFERIAEFEALREASSKSKASSPAALPSSDVSATEVEIFSQAVEEILRTWKFPGLKRVTFSEGDDDVIISGRRRSSHGKGVRAITHAAFTLGLMRYCSMKAMPHPGLVVLDSPLVVYREPDPDEKGFEPHLKEAFYQSIATMFSGQQVIIFENDDPPSNIGSATVVKFSGTSQGRQGFIPLSSSAT